MLAVREMWRALQESLQELRFCRSIVQHTGSARIQVMLEYILISE